MKMLGALAFTLLCAGSAMPAVANTVASSTLWFEGTLEQGSDGTYSGTIAAIEGVHYVPGGAGAEDGIEGGFDIYAQNGAYGMYGHRGDQGDDYLSGLISDHDVYNESGGWGLWYDPDNEDWDNYQLTLAGDTWAVEYNANVGNDHILTGASCAPMSGLVDWASLWAAETGTGAYYSGGGTPADDGWAAEFAADKGQSTVGAWDMDWSWGSDYAPLQYGGYQIDFINMGGGDEGMESEGQFQVSLTPVPEPSTLMLYGLALMGLAGFGYRKFNK